MKRLLFIAALAGLGWYQFQERAQRSSDLDVDPNPHLAESVPLMSNETFQCDGRIHCSQMSSCSEATFFIQNCPGTKMDGDSDGLPCEDQWC